jgi:hypothetical protein
MMYCKYCQSRFENVIMWLLASFVIVNIVSLVNTLNSWHARYVRFLYDCYVFIFPHVLLQNIMIVGPIPSRYTLFRPEGNHEPR